MGNEVILSLDTHHASKVLGALTREIEQVPKDINKVVIRALRRTIISMRAEVTKAVKEEYAVKVGYIKRDIRLHYASYKYPVARLAIRTESAIGLVHWNARKRKEGVYVRIKRKGRDKLLTQNVAEEHGVQGIFMAKKQVFGRIGDKRLPIRKLYGPSFFSVLKDPELQQATLERGLETFEKRVVAETNNVIRKRLEKAGAQ